MDTEFESEKGILLSKLAGALIEAEQSERALQIARDIESEDREGLALSWIAHEFARRGDVKNALEVVQLSSNRELQDTLLSGITPTLAKEGNRERALQLTQTIRDEELRNYALQQIVNSLSLIGEADFALEVIDIISNDKVKQDALERVAANLLEAGKISQAQQLIQDWSEREREVRLAMAIVNILWQSDSLKYSKNLWNRALQIARTIPGQTLRVEMTMSIVNDLALRAEFGRALQVLKDISESNSERSSLTAILGNLAAGNIDTSIKLARGIPTDDPLRTVAMRWIIVAVTNSGQYDRALKLTSEIAPWEESKTKCQIAVALQRAGRVDAAIELARTANEEMGDYHILRVLAINAARAGDTNRVLQLLHLGPHFSWQAWLLQEVIPPLVAAGKADQLLEAASSLSEKPLKVYFIAYTARSLAERGEKQRATEIIEEALDWVER